MGDVGSILGLVAGAYLVYYLNSNGYLDQLIASIPKGAPAATPAPKEAAAPAKAEKKPAKKEEKKAKFASVSYVAAYHGWFPHDHRVTV